MCAAEVDVSADAPAAAVPGCPVVGIGASAGGLAAFEAFFAAMPADTDSAAAFVLVQHLAPDHKSLLADLVRRYTRMNVVEAADGMVVKPNCAYVIPPNRDMAFQGGALRLLEPSAPRGLRLPIDFFFRSLAQDQHERAICIVLSGTGSDGTLGVRAVKGGGGMAMAQSPESAEHAGMPRSAIETGLVDYVLPPDKMPAQLIAYIGHAFGQLAPPDASRPQNVHDALQKVFIVLRAQTGHDFSLYKQNTIARRVERRMALHQIEDLDDYVRYLQQSPGEVDALFRDFLIGVTSFFRDPEAFAGLEEHGIPRLFAGKLPGSPVRVWVPACSTGEEAYSLAILLQERMDTLQQRFQLQIFATDIDGGSVARARAGVYPASIAADVTPARLARFFSQDAQGGPYRISKAIRDLLVFSEQDVLKDPPFSRIDLLSCRNVLIYLGVDAQRKLVQLFHYALAPAGLLFFGNSETIGDAGDLFATVDRSAKLYQRRKQVLHGVQRPAMTSTLPPLGEGRLPLRAHGHLTGNRRTMREVAERALLLHCAPVGALVDETGDILYLHGRTGQYLEPAPGDPGANILKMAREGLRLALTSALHKAAVRGESVCHPGLRVRSNGGCTIADLHVAPVAAPADATAEPRLFLVVLEAREDAPASGAHEAIPPDAPTGDAGAGISALREALRAKEEYLQSANEELQSTNEELQSTNEELQSTNEELQSTNEELETSKEELQSVNEELATVNAELQQKVADLSQANNDMNNLLAGTGIGTIFVDHELRIQRFTPAATQVINLIPTDVGRPVDHVVSNFVGYDRLVEDVRAVLDSLVPMEVEAQTKAGIWYSLRIRPYRTLENVIEGVVIAFVDITETKRARESIREGEALRRLAVVLRDARDAITVLDLQGHILAWNPGAERLYGWSEAEALVMSVSQLYTEEQAAGELANLERLGRSEVLQPHRARRRTKAGRLVDVWLTATALVNDVGQVYAVAMTERAAGVAEP